MPHSRLKNLATPVRRPRRYAIHLSQCKLRRRRPLPPRPPSSRAKKASQTSITLPRAIRRRVRTLVESNVQFPSHQRAEQRSNCIAGHPCLVHFRFTTAILSTTRPHQDCLQEQKIHDTTAAYAKHRQQLHTAEIALAYYTSDSIRRPRLAKRSSVGRLLVTSSMLTTQKKTQSRCRCQPTGKHTNAAQNKPLRTLQENTAGITTHKFQVICIQKKRVHAVQSV